MRKLSLLIVQLILLVAIGYTQTVTIGTQVWMTKNLNVDTFRNGDPIPEAKTNEEWKRARENEQPAWCYYDNNTANGEKYGKLYNWYAVNDSRGLAPNGCHVPTDEEWTVLIDYLGGELMAGGRMKAKTGWENEGNGINSSGFSGLPGGARGYDGAFNLIGEYGSWWSSTEDDTNVARGRGLLYYSIIGYRYNYSKNVGLSVRCLRD